MGMKKMPVVLMACMLLFSSLHVLAQNQNGAVPVECCFNFFTHRLAKDKVAKYQRTSFHCANNGVVFTMQNGREFCADATQKWVQGIITYLESKPSNQ